MERCSECIKRKQRKHTGPYYHNAFLSNMSLKYHLMFLFPWFSKMAHVGNIPHNKISTYHSRLLHWDNICSSILNPSNLPSFFLYIWLSNVIYITQIQWLFCPCPFLPHGLTTFVLHLLFHNLFPSDILIPHSNYSLHFISATLKILLNCLYSVSHHAFRDPSFASK